MLPRLQIDRRYIQGLYLVMQIGFVLAVVAWVGWWLGQGREELLSLIGIMTVGALFAIVVWLYPALGLIITISSLPLQDLLTRIPLGSQLTTALGGLTLFAFIYQRNGRKLFSYGFQYQFLFGGAFVIWQLLINPQASFYGTRNWMFTYTQLLILMWLGSELLTPQRHVAVMRTYVVAAVISGLYAFSQAEIVADFAAGSGLVRSHGLAQNQNSLAFYLVLALVFTAYLQRQSTNPWASLLYPAIYVSLIVGIVGTVSRAGFLTTALALILLVGFWLEGGRNRVRSLLLSGLVLIFGVLYVVPEDYWTVMQETIFTEDITEEGNFGSRNALIQAGWEVWKDNPVMGVGIDQFRFVNRSYLTGEYRRVAGRVAHNFYVSLLSETGLVGFLLVMGWVIMSMRDLWYTILMRARLSPLATIWLIAFILFLFRGYTASTMHYDKLFWLMGGISIAIYRMALAEKAQNASSASKSKPAYESA